MSTDVIPEPAPMRVPEPILDVALLRKAVEWAEAEVEKQARGGLSEYDQSLWMGREGYENSCGTTYCIAGYICVLNEDEATTMERYDYFMDQEGDLGVDDLVDNWDGEIAHQHWAIRASELLGVSYADTARLFYGMNNIVHVRYFAEMLVSAFAPDERL